MHSAKTPWSRSSIHRRPTAVSGRTISTFDQLQDELICEIFSRLPSHSLLRIRCVSKSWKSLIDSLHFIKSHLSQYGNSKIYLFCGTDNGSSPSDPTRLITLVFQGFDFITNSCQSFNVPLNFPSFPHDLAMRVVGTCDGLLCLVSLKLDLIVLVNPSTREVYPISPPKSRRSGFCDIGFGYDPVGDDYKVVMIQRMGKHNDIEVCIYYFKSKTWKKTTIYPSSSYNDYIASLYGYYTHGALHWIMPDDANNTFSWYSLRVHKRFHIASFDLVKEKYTVDTYDTNMFGNPTHVGLVVLGGCLSLCCTSRDSRKVMDIWMMKEYRAKESWVKLVSIGVDILPLALSKCGRRLLLQELGCFGLHWYDFDTKSFSDTGIRLMRTSGCLACRESLIRLSGKTRPGP